MKPLQNMKQHDVRHMKSRCDFQQYKVMDVKGATNADIFKMRMKIFTSNDGLSHHNGDLDQFQACVELSRNFDHFEEKIEQSIERMQEVLEALVEVKYAKLIERVRVQEENRLKTVQVRKSKKKKIKS